MLKIRQWENAAFPPTLKIFYLSCPDIWIFIKIFRLAGWEVALGSRLCLLPFLEASVQGRNKPLRQLWAFSNILRCTKWPQILFLYMLLPLSSAHTCPKGQISEGLWESPFLVVVPNFLEMAPCNVGTASLSDSVLPLWQCLSMEDGPTIGEEIYGLGSMAMSQSPKSAIDDLSVSFFCHREIKQLWSLLNFTYQTF